MMRLDSNKVMCLSRLMVTSVVVAVVIVVVVRLCEGIKWNLKS